MQLKVCMIFSHVEYKSREISRKFSRVTYFTFSIYRNRSIAASTSHPEMKRTILRAKNHGILRGSVKSRYGSLKEFGEHLQQNPDSSKFIDTEININLSISAELIQSSSESYHVLFYDEKLMSEYQQENSILIDSTFAIVPDIRGAKQFLTIMCKKYDTVW